MQPSWLQTHSERFQNPDVRIGLYILYNEAGEVTTGTWHQLYYRRFGTGLECVG